MDFCALRQETFATALATSREGSPPAFRAHPRTKAVLLFPGALGAL